jgi:hypothetical protein
MRRSNLSKKIFLLVALMSLLVVIVYAFQSNNEIVLQTTPDVQQEQVIQVAVALREMIENKEL